MVFNSLSFTQNCHKLSGLTFKTTIGQDYYSIGKVMINLVTEIPKMMLKKTAE